jgi:hypothetical protein
MKATRCYNSRKTFRPVLENSDRVDSDLVNSAELTTYCIDSANRSVLRAGLVLNQLSQSMTRLVQYQLAQLGRVHTYSAESVLNRILALLCYYKVCFGKISVCRGHSLACILEDILEQNFLDRILALFQPLCGPSTDLFLFLPACCKSAQQTWGLRRSIKCVHGMFILRDFGSFIFHFVSGTDMSITCHKFCCWLEVFLAVILGFRLYFNLFGTVF